MMYVKKSRIEEGELVFLDGYMWASDEETLRVFERQRQNDVGFRVGAFALDLYDGVDLLDTVTVQEEPI